MGRKRAVQILAVVASVAAAFICYKLLVKHVTGTSGSGWFEAGCTGEGDAGGVNCAAVLASPYSYIPPKHSEEPDGRPRLPAAFVGLVYYSALAMWFMGIGRPSAQRRRVHWVPLAFVCFGLAGSIYFTVIMFSVLEEWCPWCVVTHGLNVVIAVLVVVMWPRPAEVSEETPVVAARREGGRGEAFEPHPTKRLVAFTLVAILSVTYGELNMLGLKSWKRQAQVHQVNFQKCRDAVDRLTADTSTLVRNWKMAPACVFGADAERPVRGGADGGAVTMDVVVFSDFQCPMCRRFAPFFEERVQPLFSGNLRMSFRHYPIDTACNPVVSRTVHAQACLAARLAEAARIVGGDEAFFMAHDYLFEQAEEVKRGRVGAKELAEHLGLDAGAVRGAMESEEASARIRADAEQARKCQIRGTPSVFVEGRLVDVLAVMDIRFWDRLADVYWKRSRQPRPPQTRLREAPVPAP